MLFFCLVASSTFASNDRPDTYAPAGIVGSHLLETDQFAFEYSFKSMTSEDLGMKSSTVSAEEILAIENRTDLYISAPTQFSIEQHVLSLSFAPNENVTWNINLPYFFLNMKNVISPIHQKYPLNTFETESDGIGDIQIHASFPLEKTLDTQMFIGIGVSLPTGSIDQKDKQLFVKKLGNTQQAFPMQLSSGTYDVLPSFTHIHYFEKSSWGKQVSAVIHLGQNDNNYTLGNSVQANTWHAWVLNREMSASIRIALTHWDNIDGQDNTLQIPQEIIINNMSYRSTPLIDSGNQAGESVQMGLGLNGVYGQAKHSLALEIVTPLYETLDGPQIQSGVEFVLAYQKLF